MLALPHGHARVVGGRIVQALHAALPRVTLQLLVRCERDFVEYWRLRIRIVLVGVAIGAAEGAFASQLVIASFCVALRRGAELVAVRRREVAAIGCGGGLLWRVSGAPLIFGYRVLPAPKKHPP